MQKYYSILSLLFLFGCHEKAEEHFDTNSSAEVIHISLDDSPEWNFTDYFEFSNTIALESSSIISGINKLIFHNDKILILDKKTKSILKFSNKGILEKRMHFVGKGPEEYLEISDFIVDKQVNDILVLDGEVGQQMVRYDWNGNFKKKKPIPFKCNSFELIQDDYMVYCGNRQSKENTIDANFFSNIVICDSDFQVVYKQVPVSKGWNGRRYLFNNNTAFIKYGEATYCQIPMPNDNTIYSLVEGKLIPKYRFDFGFDLKKLLTTHITLKEIWPFINKSDIPHNLNSYFENDQIIYFAVKSGENVKQIIYDKTRREAFNRSVSLDKLDKHFFPLEYQGDGTFLVHVLFPYLIHGNELEEYIPEEIRIKTKAEDNPILVLFNVKKRFGSRD